MNVMGVSTAYYFEALTSGLTALVGKFWRRNLYIIFCDTDLYYSGQARL